MSAERSSDDGFSIIEVIIAMFLLAIVAVAILPALWQGITLSAQQSATATATRHLNALVEEVRESLTCGSLAAVAASRTVTDGSGRVITSSGIAGTCVALTAVSLRLQAVDTAGRVLATTSARVYIP